MDNLDIQHHVKLRNSLRKREIAISEEIRNIRSKTFYGETEIIKALAKSDKEFYEMQLAHIRSDIAKQEVLINSYMDNLEN